MQLATTTTADSPRRRLPVLGSAPVAAEPAPLPPLAAGPDLASYDWIVVNTSAGKDSQVSLEQVLRAARAAGVEHKVVAVHCDLGRVEWAGTKELAVEQCECLGVELFIVKHAKDMLDRIRERGQFPDPARRWCTSDFKRSQVYKLMTSLVGDWREAVGLGRNGRKGRPCRVLNVMGLRAQESPARAKKTAFERDVRASNTKRTVDTWLPIHEWTHEQVWESIRQSGIPHHRAYDLGMPRLSCVFCFYAPKACLLLAAEHNEELLDTYCEVEDEIGHDFVYGLRINTIRDALRRGERADPAAVSKDVGCWNM